MTFTSLRGSTKLQTWFLSKFSNSSCMTLTQFKLKRACPISRGSKRVTKNVFMKQERWADIEDRVTISFRLHLICWGICAFWMWEEVTDSEMISSSTYDVSTVTVKEVVAWGGSASNMKTVTWLDDNIEENSGLSLSLLIPYDPSSMKCSPTCGAKTEETQRAN
jgi:hypothetical protein